MTRPSTSLPRAFLCVEPVDFRKSIDGLSMIVQEQSSLDPFEPTLYCFINRRADKVKILDWERDGFCLRDEAAREAVLSLADQCRR